MKSLSIKLGASITLLFVLAACNKDSNPIPEPIIKTLPNTITITASPLTTINGNVGETKSIARLKGTSLSGGAIVSTFTVNGDSFTVSEHPSYPSDSLVLSYNAVGGGSVNQKLVAAQQVVNEDTNGDGVVDTTTFTATEKVASTTVAIELPEENRVNTVTLTNDTEIPATFEATIGTVYEIPKLAGTVISGDVVYTIATNNDSLIEWIDSGNETTLKFKVLAAGNIIITQSIASSDQVVLEDNDGDGNPDMQINYTGEVKEATTNVEGVDVVFGIDAEGVATLQEYFAGKLLQMEEGESMYIAYSDFLTIPNPEMMNGVYANWTVFPYQAIEIVEVLENGIRVGVNISHKYDYVKDDLKITFTTELNNLLVEFPIPYGVSLDTSDLVQLNADLVNHIEDMCVTDQNGVLQEMVRIWGDNKSPKIFINGFNAGSDEYVLLQKSIDNMNENLEKGGAVKEDGTPFRISIVTDTGSATIQLFLGDGSAFSEYVGGGPNPIEGVAGLAQLIYKDDNPDTGIIVAGGAWAKDFDWDTAQGRVSTIMQELTTVLGFPGEMNEKMTSITAETNHGIYLSWLDSAAFRVLYSSPIEPGMTIPEFRAAYSLPLATTTQQIIDEIAAIPDN